jgi:Spy/CpxP family protein refolding chaperone
MKRVYTLSIALALLALVGGLAPSAFARPEHGFGDFAHFEEHTNRALHQLGLSDSQQSTVQTLLRTHAKEVIRLKGEIATMRVDLRPLLHTDPVDMNRVKQAFQAIAAKEVDLHLAHLTVMQDIRQVLTAEQQKKFRAMMEHHHGREEGEHHDHEEGEHR